MFGNLATTDTICYPVNLSLVLKSSKPYFEK